MSTREKILNMANYWTAIKNEHHYFICKLGESKQMKQKVCV